MPCTEIDLGVQKTSDKMQYMHLYEYKLITSLNFKILIHFFLMLYK